LPAESNTTPKRRTHSTQRYVRNLYTSSLGLRVSVDERFELQPRGMRGDLVPMSKEQIARLGNNIGLVVEVISEAEAQKIIGQQTTNQQAHHPALDALRDPLGEQYEQETVELAADPQTEGETVALLKDGQIVTERVPGKGQQIVRDPRSVGPHIATDVPGCDPQFDLAADDAARSGQSLEDVLGGFDVQR
jgi:hypothetical protein